MSQISQRQAAATCRYMPLQAVRPGNYLQEPRSHHKMEIFTAHILAHGILEYGWGQRKNDCVSRGVLIRFLQLQSHLRTDQNGSQATCCVTLSTASGKKKKSLNQNKPNKTGNLVCCCLQTSADCKQALKGLLKWIIRINISLSSRLCNHVCVCLQNTLETCTICSKPIMERILRATGKAYHPHCFTCVVCHRSLDGIPFTVDASNQIHCIEDFHKYVVQGFQLSFFFLRVLTMDQTFLLQTFRGMTPIVLLWPSAFHHIFLEALDFFFMYIFL